MGNFEARLERQWELEDLAARTCPTCQGTMALVCGERVCGTCYGEALVAEPFRQPRPALPLPTYPCCGLVYIHLDTHHHCEVPRA